MIFNGLCDLYIGSNMVCLTVFRRRETFEDIFPNLLFNLLNHLSINWLSYVSLFHLKLDYILIQSFKNSILLQYDILSRNLELFFDRAQLSNRCISISSYIPSRKTLIDLLFSKQTDLIAIYFCHHLTLISNLFFSTSRHLLFEKTYYFFAKYYVQCSKLLRKFYTHWA
jgi:hypothetical protein